MTQNNVVSLSGGKDSTAMLLMMLERGEHIHSIAAFDTGWEFPEMYVHLDKLEAYIGRKIWRLQSRFPFDYWATARPLIAKKGPLKGKVHRVGNGWPSPSRRWCTREKTDTLHLFAKPIPEAVQCVGFALDESDRSFSRPGVNVRFPLIEYGVTEAEALQYCHDRGFDWGGLYDHFKRVSCYCCPLSRIGELKKVRRHYPDLWRRMLNLEDAMPEGTNRGFKDDSTVRDLDARFALEDCQINGFERRVCP